MQGNIGILVRLRDDIKAYVIVKITDNSPAAKSGEVQENDILLAVAGKPVNGLSITEVTSLLDGAVDSFVRLKLQRDGIIFDSKQRRGDPSEWKAKSELKKTNSTKETSKVDEKMTDKARAQRFANGDQYRAVNKRVRDKEPAKLSPRSLAAEQARVRKEHEVAQRAADALYAQNVARDEVERKRHTDALLDSVLGEKPPPESWWQRRRRESLSWWQSTKRDIMAHLAINLFEHKIAKAQKSGSSALCSWCCAEARQ